MKQFEPQYYSLPFWQCDQKPAPRIDVTPLIALHRWDISRVKTESALISAFKLLLRKGWRCQLCGDYLREGQRTIEHHAHVECFMIACVPDMTQPGYLAGGVH